jgi:hypothetical protein
MQKPVSEASAAFALHGGDVTLQSFAPDACTQEILRALHQF